MARIKIKVVPNARKNFLAGAYGDAAKIKIAAPAVDGKANAELIKFVATTLGIRKGNIEIVSGETSRDKTLEITVPADIDRLFADTAK